MVGDGGILKKIVQLVEMSTKTFFSSMKMGKLSSRSS